MTRLPRNLTRVVVPPRPDLAKPHDFKVGERVRMKREHLNPNVDQALWTGTVRRLPEGPVVKVGPHVLGNEMSVALDSGGVGVGDVDKWERVP